MFDEKNSNCKELINEEVNSEKKTPKFINPLQEKRENFINSLQYENRLIIFLDILGWRETIKNSITNDTSKLLYNIGNALDAIEDIIGIVKFTTNWEGEGKPQAAQFSDSIVVSIDLISIAEACGQKEEEFLKTNPESQRVTIKIFETLLRKLLLRGFFVRGGIAYGKLYHKDSMIFGPALIDAVDLEKKAKYPRILLHPDLAKYWANGYELKEPDPENINNSISAKTKPWRLDKKDRKYFFDFFPTLIHGNPHISPKFLEFLLNDFEFFRERIVDGLKKFWLYPNIHEKYVWLANYFNEILYEYDANNIQKILLEQYS